MLPLARRMIVEERRWLTPIEFTELLGLCQFLPGGNIINLSVAIGTRFCGVPGRDRRPGRIDRRNRRPS
ncbi:MAG: chromate transporter [Hyphomicrobium sp.]